MYVAGTESADLTIPAIPKAWLKTNLTSRSSKQLSSCRRVCRISLSDEATRLIRTDDAKSYARAQRIGSPGPVLVGEIFPERLLGI